ncbi:MAG: alpha/beta hydrolase family protein [Planctomycetia bacterium]
MPVPHPRRIAAAVLFTLSILTATGGAAADRRLGPLKDLDGFFPFEPPATREAWQARAADVRRRILVSQGLWPMPAKTPLKPVIHGTIERDGYTVSKVFFESAPGFYVTGNLYRPLKPQGKVPGVLFAHGHWKDARLSDQPPDKVRADIAAGEERFEQGGRSRFQSLCVQLARMGCVVWQWDMLGDSDSRQLSRDLVHGFKTQRPEMNAPSRWGLYSPQAEAWLQNVMGLQTLNAIRSLDFLLGLPEVDPERVAITGSSGGGTQTMILAAIDDRIRLSFPVVMVSTAMQGGCTCENASLLRIGTGNVEFAALAAPRPQGMNTADDWTRELATKGFPDLQKAYALFGAKDAVMLHRGEHFPHNYNAVTRSAFYTFLNQRFALGFPSPVVERDYTPLSVPQLSVWDAEHPAPKPADPDFERNLLAWFTSDAETQVRKAAATPEGLRQAVLPAVETIIGRTFDSAGDASWELDEKEARPGHVRMRGRLVNVTYGEEVPVAWIYPERWSGRVVAWLDDDGVRGLVNADGSPRPAVEKLVAAGTAVVAADLMLHRDGAIVAGEPPRQRVVKNNREFAGYTYGYNDTLFAQSVHDVLTLVRFLRKATVGAHPHPRSVAIAGVGDAGPIVLAARAVSGDAIDHAAAATRGFRFATLDDYRHPLFLPGGAKYLDVPGLVALAASRPLWLADPRDDAGAIAVGSAPAGRLTRFTGNAAAERTAAAEWLLAEDAR